MKKPILVAEGGNSEIIV